MSLIFIWWTCPEGHKSLEYPEVVKDDGQTICDECGKEYQVSEGEIGEKENVPDAFSHLRG